MTNDPSGWLGALALLVGLGYTVRQAAKRRHRASQRLERMRQAYRGNIP